MSRTLYALRSAGRRDLLGLLADGKVTLPELHEAYEKRGDEWRILERECVYEGSTTQKIEEMAIDAARFKQGGFDRPSSARPVGP